MHYPEPTTTPGLPVWTDELSRELRLHTGIDHPPTTSDEAFTVMIHGLNLDPQEVATARELVSNRDWPDGWFDELKQHYRQRCKKLHPDAGGSEVALKALQVAYRILKGCQL